MNEFKQRPNGHYYKGDCCPYCSSNVKDCITIGRSTDNDVVILNPFVNKEHCRIERIAEWHYRITDLQSTNGTFVNGKRVDGSMVIGPYDEVHVGGSQVTWLRHFAISEDVVPELPECQANRIPKMTKPHEEYHLCPNGHYYKGDGPCPYCREASCLYS